MTGGGACIRARGCVVASTATRIIDAVYTQRAPFHRALATRRFWQLVGEILMDKRPRFKRTGHHAIAAADTDVFVHQNKAITTLERRAGGTDVHARRMLAVLTHDWHRYVFTSLLVSQLKLANPLRIRQRCIKTI